MRYGASQASLVAWSPVAGDNCQVELGSLDELRKLQPGLEARGRAFTGYAGALFRSPELPNYELARLLPMACSPHDDLPADVARLLGWPAGELRTPGAHPVRPASPAAGRRRLVK